MRIRHKGLLVAALPLLAVGYLAGASQSKQAKIKRALSAAPPNIAQGATVAERQVTKDAQGRPTVKMTVLRQGTNGFTCLPGTPGVVGDDPACANAAGLQWAKDLLEHKPKPTNTTTGIIYMLAGGTDWSAAKPYVTGGEVIHEPPHYMIALPYGVKNLGLSTKPQKTGTWVMWAGTPYAHLMVMQVP